jgi:FtsH-binding integral membrane protein
MEKTHLSESEMKKMQKDMAPYYGLQLVLTIVFTYVLAMMIYNLKMSDQGWNAYGVAGWVWLGFVAPTQIAGVVWANTKKQFWAKQIFVMVTYQLVGLMLAAFFLSR